MEIKKVQIKDKIERQTTLVLGNRGTGKTTQTLFQIKQINNSGVGTFVFHDVDHKLIKSQCDNLNITLSLKPLGDIDFIKGQTFVLDFKYLNEEEKPAIIHETKSILNQIYSDETTRNIIIACSYEDYDNLELSKYLKPNSKIFLALLDIHHKNHLASLNSKEWLSLRRKLNNNIQYETVKAYQSYIANK